MKILKGDKENIDLAHPIELTEEQKERFINFFKDMFYYVEIKEIPSLGRARLGDKSFQREWADEEYELLLKIDESNESVSRQLGRSWMSVEMKRLDRIPEMQEYASKNGVDIYKADIKQLVKNFLKEHKDKIFKRKEERKKERDEEKHRKREYLALKKDIPTYESLIESPISLITKEELEIMKERLKTLEKEYRGKINS